MAHAYSLVSKLCSDEEEARLENTHAGGHWHSVKVLQTYLCHLKHHSVKVLQTYPSPEMSQRQSTSNVCYLQHHSVKVFQICHLKYHNVKVLQTYLSPETPQCQSISDLSLSFETSYCQSTSLSPETPVSKYFRPISVT